MENQIKEIKQRFRQTMNGEVSKQMRDRGMDFHVIFGISLPVLKQIAADYPKDEKVATYLWSENVRESKILASMLYPPDLFTPELAESWVNEINSTELAEQTVIFLFAKLPFAPALYHQWIRNDKTMIKYTGYLLASRYIKSESSITDSDLQDFLVHAKMDAEQDDRLIKIAAINAVKCFIRLNRNVANKIIDYFSDWKHHSNVSYHFFYDDFCSELELNTVE